MLWLWRLVFFGLSSSFEFEFLEICGYDDDLGYLRYGFYDVWFYLYGRDIFDFI